MNNDNTLSAKLTRIETAVDRIRTKTDTATDTIENVASAVEDLVAPEGNINITNTSSTDVSQYATAQVVDSNLVAGNIKKDTTILGVTGSYEGSGGGGSTNIYRVESLEEMEEIDNPQDDDICVVLKLEIGGLTSSSNTDTLFFPATFTCDPAITSSAWPRFVAGEQGTQSIDASISASDINIYMQDYSTGAFEELCTYTSSDGITYTRTTELESYTFAGTLTDEMNSFTRYGDLIEQCIFYKAINFGGLFSYNESEEAWEYTDVGLNIESGKIFTTQKVYGNQGKVTGTFDRNKHFENYLAVSYTQPTDGTKIWAKPNVPNENYKFYDFITKPITYNELDTFNKYTATTSFGSFSKTAYTSTIIVGDYLYIFSSVGSYKVHLTDNSATSIASPSLSNTYTNSALIEDNGYIYYMSRIYYGKYSIANNSWSSISSSISGLATNDISTIFKYDGYIYVSTGFKSMHKYSISNNAWTTITLPEELQAASSASRIPCVLFREDNILYIYDRLNNKLQKYDFVNNSLVTQLTITPSLVTDSNSSKYDFPASSWQVNMGAGNYSHNTYEDSTYMYSIGAEGSAMSSTHLIKLNKNTVKKCFTENNADLFIYEGAFSRFYIPTNNANVPGKDMNKSRFYNGNIYSVLWGKPSGSSNYKFYLVIRTLEDIIQYSTPKSSYIVVIDNSKDTYKIYNKEHNLDSFDDIYCIFQEGKYEDSYNSLMWKCNIYIYDETQHQYNLLKQNYVE